MLDLFVPTCQRDAGQLALLLRSLDTYLERAAVASLTLAAVDVAGFEPAMRAIDTLGLSSRTRRLTLADLGLPGANGDYAQGWCLQQAAKLAFARRASTEFFMILDSKNLALRPVALAGLVTEGRAAQVLEPMATHLPWWRGSRWALGHTHFDVRPTRRALSSATPVLMHTASAVALVDWIERHHGGSLARFFTRPRLRHLFMRPTEFTLYHTYMDREDLLGKCHFASDTLHDPAVQIWGSHAGEVRGERLARLLSTPAAGLFTGIARPAWEAFSAEERDRVHRRVANG